MALVPAVHRVDRWCWSSTAAVASTSPTCWTNAGLDAVARRADTADARARRRGGRGGHVGRGRHRSGPASHRRRRLPSSRATWWSGLRWDGGYGRLDAVIDAEGDADDVVRRPLRLMSGDLPRARRARAAGRARLPERPDGSRAGSARGHSAGAVGRLPGVARDAVQRRHEQHLGHRGPRELALARRRSPHGADPDRRRLPDAGGVLPQRPGRATRPQRQAPLRAHRVARPGGDGALRVGRRCRRCRAGRLLDGRGHRHGVPAALRACRPGSRRDHGRAHAGLLGHGRRQRVA